VPQVKKLFNLKQWLTVPDAARHLSILLGEDLSEADVLQLALDGQLTLSVHFVNGARGRCGSVVDLEDAKRTVREENPDDWTQLTGSPPDKVFWHSLDGLSLGDGRVLEYVRETELLDGVWDLTMLGHERFEIGQRYQFLTKGPEIDMSVQDGPLDHPIVSREDGTFCQIHEPHFPAKHYFPADALPADSVLVVRTSALNDLEARLSEPDQSIGRSLETKERATLLVIIAALAKLAKIDITRPTKAGDTIETQTALLGSVVTSRAIQDHLNRIPEALARRNK
jgi:hypothetical protein